LNPKAGISRIANVPEYQSLSVIWSKAGRSCPNPPKRCEGKLIGLREKSRTAAMRGDSEQ